MNANRLLAHFERISDAPDAVDRLRRFILDLAVRGKLVEQDTRDGTATDLLAQHRLVVEPSGEMQPFPLPDSWAWVPVGVVCSKTGSGSTPRGGKAAYVSKGIPFLRSQNVHDDGLTLDDVAYIDGATHGKMIGTAVQPDDLLLNITGGSMGRCCHVSSSFKEGNVSQHVAILRVAIPGTQAFLHKCIISPFFQGLIFDEQTGAGRGGLPKNKMDRLPVPLPPLAEQHRIVAKVDELMQLCDRLETSQEERESRRDRLVVASLNRLSQPTDPDEFRKDAGFPLSNLNRLSTKPEHIKELRKAILNLAVRGKLVPQDESEEPPPTALKLEDGTDAHDADRPKHLRYLTTEGERHPIPRSWLWTRLGIIGDWGSGTTPSRGKAEYFGGSVSWFKSGELNDNRHLTGSDECVTPLALKECSFRRNKPGDVLFAMYGATIGKVAILAEEAVTNQAVVACTPCAHLSNQYLFLFLLSQRQRFHMASEGGAQPNVSKAKVIRCPIPLPPLAEQKRIVAKVDELMLICDQLENQLEKQRKGRRQLLEALLHEALEGVE